MLLYRGLVVDVEGWTTPDPGGSWPKVEMGKSPSDEPPPSFRGIRCLRFFLLDEAISLDIKVFLLFFLKKEKVPFGLQVGFLA
jgi:hypothetical protein